MNIEQTNVGIQLSQIGVGVGLIQGVSYKKVDVWVDNKKNMDTVFPNSGNFGMCHPVFKMYIRGKDRELTD